MTLRGYRTLGTLGLLISTIGASVGCATGQESTNIGAFAGNAGTSGAAGTGGMSGTSGAAGNGETCPGATLCNGVCTNPKFDPANCGMCGVACAADQVCSQGT